jgi:parallel beta-helix repeat protein
MEDGDTLHLPAGTYKLTQSLLVDGYDNFVIQGAGLDKTILQFSGQQSGAEGFKISNCNRLTVRDFTVLNTAGDAIKAQNCDDIRFINVETSWTGKPKSTNGSYGLYPVQCNQVLIDSCRARGASDAGIYVGQSDEVTVRNCVATENVAGIEIENTTNAKVYDNLAEGNTGGILVFDLPGLIKKKGGNVEVFRNEVKANNLKNFAPKGNIVAQVPPGTGVMVLATSDVLIRDNDITENKTASIAIVSYYITELPIQDEEYDPIPQGIRIESNDIVREKQWPNLKNKIGKLLAVKFGRKVPPIIYDGITEETLAGNDLDNDNLAISFDRFQADFAMLDAARKFKHLERNPSAFTFSSEKRSTHTSNFD